MGVGTLEGSANVHGYGWVWASVAPDEVEKQQNFDSSSAILHQSLGDVWEFSPNELAFNMLIFLMEGVSQNLWSPLRFPSIHNSVI